MPNSTDKPLKKRQPSPIEEPLDLDFEGERRHFMAIVCGGGPIPPTQHKAFAGMTIPYRTSTVIASEEEGELWSTLSAPEPGVEEMLTVDQLKRIIKRVKDYQVLWRRERELADGTKRPASCVIHDMAAEDLQFSPEERKFISQGKRERPNPNHVPLAKYVVIVRSEYMYAHGYRQAAEQLPTLWDLEHGNAD